ncbi:MAG: hypothetical protein ACLQIB_08020 [Isosphaeraceae bacterium]
MLILLLSSVLSATAGQDAAQLDREQLVRLIEASRSDILDFAFEYEGSYAFPREQERESQGLGPDGIQLSYSGTYARRKDGAALAETYTFNHLTKVASHSVITTINGRTESSAQSGKQTKAKVAIRRAAPADFDLTGNYGHILCTDSVLGMARSQLVYEYGGIRDLDSRKCVVVRFWHTEDPAAPKGKLISDVFWIDLERGGNVLRYEQRWGKDLAKVNTGIRLELFRAPSGRTVWLPVCGQSEGHLSVDKSNLRKRIFTTEPVYIARYDLIPVSLRLEQGLKDDRFSVKAKSGDVVTDELRRARYEFGQYLIRGQEKKAKATTDSEIKAGLDRMLSDSDVLARELTASSVERSGTPWASWIPWVVAGICSAALILTLLRHRRQQPT